MPRSRQHRADPSTTSGHRSHGAKADEAPPSVGLRTTASIQRLQELAGNQAVASMLAPSPMPAVQRVKDLFDVKLEPSSVTLAAPFKQKHVASDEAGAKAVTHARYLSGKMPAAMANGRMANTVAPEATWISAVDASETKVDTEDGAWTNDVALAVGDVWQVKWDGAANDYGVGKAAAALKAGGYAKATYAGKKGKAAKQVTGGNFIVDHIGNG